MSWPPPGPAEAPAWSTTFLSRLVHELRTPLASLQIAAEMLRDDPHLPAALGVTTGGLLDAVAHLEELIEQVGEINRIRSGRIRVARGPVDVVGLFGEVTAKAADAAQRAGATIEAVPGEPGATLASDSRLLARALGCLVHSALAAGARRVELACVAKAEAVRLEVRDDGPPPAPGEGEALFEPLAPSPRARRRHGGTGLGLPVAAAIAELLDGELTLAPSGTGSTVLALRLPRG